MPARSSSWGTGTGVGRGRERERGRGRAFATSFLGLWATINHAHFAFSLSSENSCATEGIFCAADEVCSVCIESLQSLPASSISVGSTSVDCDETFFDLCSLVQETECDYTNEKFLALAVCMVEDLFGCTGFSSCDEVSSASPAPSNSKIGGDTSAPTGSPTTVTQTEPPGATATTEPSGIEEVAEAGNTSSAGVGLLAASSATALGVGLIAGVGLLLAV